MYTDRFGLRANPFSIVPDPSFAIPTNTHMRALARLLEADSNELHWIQVIGAAGTGKSLLCRRLAELLPRVIHLASPASTPSGLYRGVWRALGGDTAIEADADVVCDLLDARAEEGTLVICADEAQAMTPAALEALRLLADPDRGRIQLLLFGNPSLTTLLASSELAALRSPICPALTLEPMTAVETACYLAQRLTIAGARGPALFSAPVAKLVHQAARGIPRSVNLIAHAALAHAWREGTPAVTAAQVRAAAADTPNASRLGAGLRVAGWIG